MILSNFLIKLSSTVKNNTPICTLYESKVKKNSYIEDTTSENIPVAKSKLGVGIPITRNCQEKKPFRNFIITYNRWI